MWFSPLLIEATPEQTLTYLAQCAGVAELLRQEFLDVTFVLGGELSFYMQGLIKGDDLLCPHCEIYQPAQFDLAHAHWRTRAGQTAQCLSHARRCNGAPAFSWAGPYAACPWEKVDWRLFDIVSVNYYRDAQNAKFYRQGLRGSNKHNKPVAITEFGCCAYKGADAKGAAGWSIVDTSGARRKIKGTVERSEETPARYLAELLEIFSQEKVESAFVFNFASYNLPTDDNPEFDLDLASSWHCQDLPNGSRGTAYPDLPWEPKKAFWAVAQAYGKENELIQSAAAGRAYHVANRQSD